MHWRVRDKNGRTSVLRRIRRGARRRSRRREARVPLAPRAQLRRSRQPRPLRYRAEDRLNVAPAIVGARAAHRSTLPRSAVVRRSRAVRSDAQPAPDDSERLPVRGGLRLRRARRDRDPAASRRTRRRDVAGARRSVLDRSKPGFEVRCYRLCKRVLMFHRSRRARPDAGAGARDAAALRRRSRRWRSWSASTVASAGAARHVDRVPRGDARLHARRRSIPRFTRSISAASRTCPRRSTASARNGSISTAKASPACSSTSAPAGSTSATSAAARFAPVATARRRARRSTLAGGGQCCSTSPATARSRWCASARPAAGLFARTENFDWDAVRHLLVAAERELRTIPTCASSISTATAAPTCWSPRTACLRWYPSLGNDGFGAAGLVPKPSDEERGPALVFADAEQAHLPRRHDRRRT